MKITYDNNRLSEIGTLMSVGDDALPDIATDISIDTTSASSPFICGVRNGFVSGFMVYGLLTFLNLHKYANIGGLSVGAFELLWSMRKSF